jgi:hypothetical protein
MSTDIDTVIVVGFVVPEEDFLKPLKVYKKEESHLEDRFDPKTGKKLKPQKVVDQEARWVYEFEGGTYEDNQTELGLNTWDLLDAIGKKFKCFVSFHGNLNWGENITVAVESKKQKKTQKGGYSFKCIGELPKANLARIAREMKKAGFKLGEPGIYPVVDIS